MEAKSGTKGIDLRDGMPQLLVLTCADDIFLFAKTSGILIYLLDTLVDTLEGVGLPLNVSKAFQSYHFNYGSATATIFNTQSKWTGRLKF